MKAVYALLGASALALAVPASAAIYSFTLTGDYTASWELDSSPVPDVVNAANFIIWDVLGDFPGSAFDEVDLQFWDAANLGGIIITDFWGGGITLVDATGDQLWTGTTAAPTFKLGTFGLTDILGQGSYTLVIADRVGPGPDPIPEPASWAMMIAGFGLVGSALRRRQRATA